ncbi:MAG: zinc-dependent metalloprotease [Phycisphaerales bacterium]
MIAHSHRVLLALLAGVACGCSAAHAEDEFPPFEQVSDGFTAIAGPADGTAGLWRVWRRDRDAQLLGELPADYEGSRFYIVPTIAGGDSQTGVYSTWHPAIRQDARQHYWTRRNNLLVLMEPNLAYRTSGDAQSRAAAERVDTDRVVLSTPIVATGPNGGPVIDLDAVLLGQAGQFFGSFTAGADLRLARIESAKAFPYNVEISLSLPRRGGQIGVVHYSIGAPPRSETYEPRRADRRVGYYYTNYNDRSLHGLDEPVVRYIHRWHVEPADPTLRLSPPKRPIVYYIEHTTPIRYRRWVREGIEAWNKAFERVGIVGAIEVRQQDAATGAYMDLDPEDMRYSFLRWTNSDMGFAIGPSHAHPDTGEIYEADIVMDEAFLDSWIRDQFDATLAGTAMAGVDRETERFLAENPSWDPRFVLAAPEDRAAVLEHHRARVEGREAAGPVPPTLSPLAWSLPDPHQAHAGGLCPCMPGLAGNIDTLRTAMLVDLVPATAGDGGADAGASLLDGLPESFVGPFLRDVISHEVGHTLGLSHNWAASSVYTFQEINSEAFRGRITHSASVMDYTPANIIVEDGTLVQGDYCPIDIGPYDYWAIEYGYTRGDTSGVLDRATLPEHRFVSEEGQTGPDPHSRTFELGENSIDYAAARIAFVHRVRARLLDDVVEDGASWQRARQIYQSTLNTQLGACITASHWIGGAHFNRNVKGAEGSAPPLTPVAVDRQRRAIAFICDNAFRDEAFGLTPEILAHLGTDQWWDSNINDRQDWPVHDAVFGVQSSALTALVNPMRIGRVLDNQVRTPAGEDALSVPELLGAVRESIWSELDAPEFGAGASDRQPAISSMRRHLQGEHVRRLIELGTGLRWPGSAAGTIQSLARAELRTLLATVERASQRRLDTATLAHLADMRERITRALDAAYIRRD